MKILQILALIFGLIISTNAQDKKQIVRLTGTVYDRFGEMIRNTDVELKSTEGKIYKARLNLSLGNYEIEIPIGIYDIKVGATLYNLKKPLRIRKFRIVSNNDKKMFLDIALNYETFRETKVIK